METRLSVPALTCGHCAAAIEPVLLEFGARQLHVDLERQEIRAEGINDVAALQAKLKSIGFSAALVSTDEKTNKSGNALQKKLLVAWFFTLPLLLHMVIPWSGLHNPFLHFLLASPVMGIGIGHFGPGFLRDLRKRSYSMDSLILIGSFAAYAYSVYGLFTPHAEHFLFFESSASIISIVLLGTFIENRALQKAVSALRRNNVEEKATFRKVTGSGRLAQFAEVSGSVLMLGDNVSLSLGESAPTDGTILSGSGFLDLSVVTGESDPVTIQAGKDLPAGAKVGSGSLQYSVSKPMAQSTLAQIENAVQQARRDRPEIQQLGDRAASIFVPLVICVAIATVLGNLWYGHGFAESMIRAIAVLVVSCPCAIGLAIPAASATALGTAANRGIIIKSSRVFGSLANLANVVFDKTGTLTERAIDITDIQLSATMDAATVTELYGVARGLALHSRHPVSQAIVQKLDPERSLELTQIREEPGIGVFGIYDGSEYRLARDTAANATSLFRGETALITFTSADRKKNKAALVIRSLLDQSINVSIASGDAPAKVGALAQELGVTTFSGALNPDEKIALVVTQQRNGSTMMVGDGINDAAALAKADVGVSFVDGMALSQSSADVVLLGSSLGAIAELVALGKKTDKIMRQNLMWAFLYNSLAIPIAACGYLSPTLAAFTMAASDVVVLANSLRLRRLPRFE